MEGVDHTLPLEYELSTTEMVEDVTLLPEENEEIDPAVSLSNGDHSTARSYETDTAEYDDETFMTTENHIQSTDSSLIRNKAEASETTTDNVWLAETLSTMLTENIEETAGTPTDVTEVPKEYFTSEVVEASTQKPDFMLEASPTTEEASATTDDSSDTTLLPRSDFTNFDLKITTTLEGLQAEVNESFDPSQIAKATSYEGSSYPTATRSATVTTTWAEPEEKHTNVTKSDENYSSKSVSRLNDEKSKKVKQENHSLVTSVTSGSTTLKVSTLPDNFNGGERNNKDEQLDSLDYYVLHMKNNVNTRKRFPVPPATVTNAINSTNVPLQKSTSTNQTDELLVYEVSQSDLNGIMNAHVKPSVVVALCICLAIVLVLVFLSIIMWVCRRHHNRSKVYLSREAAKPRAFFTKPMNPVVLPNENTTESMYMIEFQRPRAPIMLSSDQDGIYFIEKFSRTESPATDEIDTGLDNGGFTDVPLSDRGSMSTVESRKHSEPPKYKLKQKQEIDADSGIRVWSSTGSLHTISPEVVQCALPPPPYSPSISRESVCLSVHSLPPLNKSGDIVNV